MRISCIGYPCSNPNHYKQHDQQFYGDIMFHTQNIIYWIIFLVIMLAIVYIILWKIFHISMGRRILSSIAAGGAGGALIFYLIKRIPENDPIFTISFVQILFLAGMAAGILMVVLGSNISKNSHNLVVMAFAAGFLFSIFSVAGVVYRDFLKEEFHLYIRPYAIDRAVDFVIFFLISFFASLGAGSLFIQYILQEPIDENSGE